MSENKILRSRRGMVKIPTQMMLDELSESQLKAIFGNFFPVTCDITNRYGFFDGITYHGFSPMFREIIEAQPIPEYWAIFQKVGEHDILQGFQEITPEYLKSLTQENK